MQVSGAATPCPDPTTYVPVPPQLDTRKILYAGWNIGTSQNHGPGRRVYS